MPFFKNLINRFAIMKQGAQWYLLGGIMVVAALARLLFLGSNPNGFYCDEAIRGYDAYSLLLTLRDHHGDFLPLFTKAFGDVPPATHVYSIIPAIKLFGLTEFATRFPSAVIGLLTVFLTYFLVKECADRKTALLATLFMAISHWHIHSSRIAFESILLPLFTVIGLLFFVKALKKNPRFLILSAVFFGLGLHTYFSARGFIPVLVLGLAVIHWRFLWKNKPAALAAMGIFLLLFGFFLTFWITPSGLSRARQVGFAGSWQEVCAHYWAYYQPAYLFLKGDTFMRHNVHQFGQLYLWEALVIPLGLWSVMRQWKENPALRFLIWWFLIFPVPAIFMAAKDPHAMRSLTGAPLFAILSALGLYTLIGFFKGRIGKATAIGICSVVILASAVRYGYEYFVSYPAYSASAWSYGLRDAIRYAEKIPADIVVSEELGPDQWYSLILFYTKYPPKLFQESPKTFSMGKYHVVPLQALGPTDKTFVYMMPAYEISAASSRAKQLQVIYTVSDRTGAPQIAIALIKGLH